MAVVAVPGSTAPVPQESLCPPTMTYLASHGKAEQGLIFHMLCCAPVWLHTPP